MANSNDLYQAELGQYGSGLLDGGESIDLSGSDYYQIIAITCLEADTTFTALEGAAASSKYLTTDATAAWNTDFGASAAGAALANTDAFPAGVTLYGRWDKITVNAGSVMFYVAPKTGL